MQAYRSNLATMIEENGAMPKFASLSISSSYVRKTNTSLKLVPSAYSPQLSRPKRPHFRQASIEPFGSEAEIQPTVISVNSAVEIMCDHLGDFRWSRFLAVAAA